MSSCSAPILSFGPGRSWRMRHLAPGARRRGPDPLGVLGVELAIAVREVQPGDVDAGLDDPPQGLGIL